MSETPSSNPLEQTTGQSAPADAATPIPETRGLALFERLGAGGMGEVYRCGDDALGRDLAIKIIKASLRGEAACEERFRREARLTGSLQHPGIVPIHQLGQLADGRSYYTMKLVRGRTFADMLRNEPDGPERLPRLLAVVKKVCQAVAFAHSKGVIHRDLKPANVMVGEFGEVQVMDWGLAKELSRVEPAQPVEATELVETSAWVQEAAGLSRAGAALGTANYMPAEQAAGDWDIVDERADVFALGAILCQVLTGRPPYHGASRDDLLRRARRGDVAEALGRLKQSGADAALVQLCAECLSPERESRPRTAAVVAERLAAYETAVQERLRQAELERVAAQTRAREEQARAIVEQERVREALARVAAERQATRRLLGLATAVVVFVLLGGAGLVVGMVAVRAEQRRTQAALTAETAAWKQTREALNTLTDDVMEELLGKQAVLGDKEKAFLRKTLGFYEQFAAERGEGEEARAVQAEGQFRVAKLCAFLGEKVEAAAGYHAGVRLYEELTGNFPAVPLYRHHLATSHNNLGNLLADLGKGAQAEAAYRQALKLQEKLAGDFPTVPQYRLDLAKSHNNLGNLLAKLGKSKAAEAAHRQALKLYEKLVSDFPAVPQYRHGLALSHYNLGELLRDQGKGAEAEAACRRALTLQEKQVSDFPAVPQYSLDLARSHHSLGLQLSAWGKGAEAEAAYRQALKLQEKLVNDFPAVPKYRQELARSHYYLGALLRDQGRGAKGEAACRQALTLQEKLAGDFPDVPQYSQELADSRDNLGVLLSSLGKAVEAEAAHRQALTLQEKLVGGFPDVPQYRLALAGSYNNLGNLLANLGKSTEAEAAHRQALKLCETLAGDFPAVPLYRQQLAASHTNLGGLLSVRGKDAEAEAAHRQALKLFEKLAGDFPDVPQYSQELAGSYVNFGNLLHDRGQHQPALDWYGKAIPLLETILAQDARLATARLFLRNANWGHARELDHLGRYAESTKDWLRAAELDDGRERPTLGLLHSVALAHAGEHRGAVKAVEELLASSARVANTTRSGPLLYNAACVYSLSAAAVKDDAKLPEQYAVRAIVLLRQAQAAGFFKDPKQVENVKKDTDLDALRQRDDFKKLLADLVAAAKK